MCFAAVNNLKFQEFIPLSWLEVMRRMKAHLGSECWLLLPFIWFCFRTALPTKAVDGRLDSPCGTRAAHTAPDEHKFTPQQCWEGNYHKIPLVCQLLRGEKQLLLSASCEDLGLDLELIYKLKEQSMLTQLFLWNRWAAVLVRRPKSVTAQLQVLLLSGLNKLVSFSTKRNRYFIFISCLNPIRSIS